MAFSDLTDAVLSACNDAFGESVSYTPQGSSLVAITGIFNAESAELDPGTGIPVLSKIPTLGVKTSDIGGDPKIGDLVTVRSVNYKVRDFDLDGEGGATLRLHKA